MDTLSQLLSLYPVRTALDVRCHFGAPWVLEHDAMTGGVAPYHLIVRGDAMVDGMGGKEALTLSAGDIVVFPHGGAHRLYLGDPAQAASAAAVSTSISASAATSATTPAFTQPNPADWLRQSGNDGAGPATDILCGEFRFDADGAAALLAALPAMLVVRTADRADAQALRHLIAILQTEAETPRAGSEAIVRQLASALFALLIRSWLEQSLAMPGLFAVLAERRLQAALNGMLAAPGQAWTLEELAAVCHMSRATFARLFKKAAGATPADVLTKLRMAQAARLLAAGKLAAGDVAEAVGYQSEAAFNRAFKRQYGIGPGTYRRGAGTASGTGGGSGDDLAAGATITRSDKAMATHGRI